MVAVNERYPKPQQGVSKAFLKKKNKHEKLEDGELEELEAKVTKEILPNLGVKIIHKGHKWRFGKSNLEKSYKAYIW